MKIIGRAAFLELPPGTLYSKYSPCMFGAMEIKGETLSNDFYVQSISDAVACDSSDQFSEILEDARNTGSSFNMDFECEGRDGFFDQDELFAIWEHNDVQSLIQRLQQVIGPAGK